MPLRLQRPLDRLRRLDFEGRARLEDHSELNIACSPSGGPRLHDVLLSLDIQPTDRVLDVGCGKGSAMRTLLRAPFAEVAGLDLSATLIDTARRNFASLDRAGRTSLTVADVVTYDDYDRFTYLYLFNPFLGEVFDAFLANLTTSLERRPRDLTVIYYFPRCGTVLTESGLFTGPELHPGNHDKEIGLYRHRRAG